MASQLEVALAHVAVGANAASNALSGNRADRDGGRDASSAPCAAFAAKNGVALVARDTSTSSSSSSSSLLRIDRVLQHRGATRDATRITSVYLHSDGSSARVLAGDSEGNVLLWTLDENQWGLQSLVGADGEKIAGSDAIAAVTAVRTRRRWLYIAAFSSGHVAVWQRLHAPDGDSGIQSIAVQSFGVRMIMETLAATTWTTPSPDKEEDEEDVLVAAGGVDSKVHLFEIAGGSTSLASLFALEGHRGWIRAVDFQKRTSGNSSLSSLLLASASQDHRVRLWKISATPLGSASRDATASASSAGFQAAGATALYTVSFDSLLIAHEDWVTSLVWTLLPPSEDSKDLQPALVSTSMDNTVILWKKNDRVGASGAWVASLRVGEHGGNGVLSSVVLPAHDTRVDLLVLNLSGQLERWLQQPAPSKTFLPAPSLTGHTSAVTDLSWSPRGDYVISLSLDQTTRVLAPWRSNGSWHEISRAQVHGYDINCGAFIRGINANDHNDRFVCGADEKILRVFEAPDDIQTLVKAMDHGSLGEAPQKETTRVEHAYLPELSLTNKSTEKKKSENGKGSTAKLVGAYVTLGGDESSEQQPIRLPVGDTLAKKTLWPELRKLYGHGNELLCVASNHAGTLLASACKSREEKFAAVWLWQTNDWSAAQAPLEGHKSSVVQLVFSPNDEYLLSVSKDRQFCVFTKREDGSYALSDRVKAHKRIIWSCSWAPDSSLFATGARDQTFALWGPTKQEGEKEQVTWRQRGESVSTESAVTAVAFAPWYSHDDSSDTHTYLFAIGLESGAILIYTVSVTAATATCSLALTIPEELTPTATITRLAWSPSNQPVLELACASADHSVRLFRVKRQ